MNTDKVQFKAEFSERLVAFSVSILHFADILRKNRTLVPVADQLVRSATSIGANVHEARGAGSKKDYLHFFRIAVKSGHETVFWLTVVKRYDSTSKDVEVLRDECEQIVKVLTSGILTMEGKKKS